jgi:hypothetical protein
MGLRNGDLGPLIMHGFRASDGWFIIQVGREHQFAKLVEAIGHPEWVDDERFAERQGWIDHLDTVLRPAIEGWAATRTKVEACDDLAAIGHRRRSLPTPTRRWWAMSTWRLATCSSSAPAPTASTSRCWCRATPSSCPMSARDLSSGSRGSASTPTRCCGASSGSATPSWEICEPPAPSAGEQPPWLDPGKADQRGIEALLAERYEAARRRAQRPAAAPRPRSVTPLSETPICCARYRSTGGPCSAAR